MNHSDDDGTDSDATSADGSDLGSDVVQVYDSSSSPKSSPRSTVVFMKHPVRERGHSLSVERTPSLIHLAPTPRSKSLRVKKNNNGQPK